jgi:hypothetical protein
LHNRVAAELMGVTMKFMLIVAFFGASPQPGHAQVLGTYATQQGCQTAASHWPRGSDFNNTHAICIEAP